MAPPPRAESRPLGPSSNTRRAVPRSALWHRFRGATYRLQSLYAADHGREQESLRHHGSRREWSRFILSWLRRNGSSMPRCRACSIRQFQRHGGRKESVWRPGYGRQRNLFGTTNEPAGPPARWRHFRTRRRSDGDNHFVHVYGKPDGKEPLSSLIIDSNGDLFGTAEQGGANSDGSLFELTKSGGSYSTALTILFAFKGGASSGPSLPYGSPIDDSKGDYSALWS